MIRLIADMRIQFLKNKTFILCFLYLCTNAVRPYQISCPRILTRSFLSKMHTNKKNIFLQEPLHASQQYDGLNKEHHRQTEVAT